MKFFTTIVATLTFLFFIGELGAKYLLVDVDGINDSSSRDSNIDYSDAGSGSVGGPRVPGGSKHLLGNIYTHIYIYIYI